MALVIANPGAAARAAGDEGRDREIQALLDERAITHLLNEYVWRLDARDFDGYGRLFANGAVVGAGGKVIARGADQVAAMARHYLGSQSPELYSWHVLSSPSIDIDIDKGVATARTFVFTIRAPKGKPAYVYRVARYVDRFEKHDGTWHFATRQEMTDWVLEEYAVHFSADGPAAPPAPTATQAPASTR